MIPAARHADAEAARRCVRGELVAEELSTSARELVVAWLHAHGHTDVEVAALTRMSTYTASRIRSRLGLPARRFPGMARSSAHGA